MRERRREKPDFEAGLEKLSQEAEGHEDGARIEHLARDLHRQMDTKGFVLARREALSTRAAAPPYRKRFAANADQNSSPSRIHRINRPAREGNPGHCRRVFPHPTRKDTHRSVERNVPLVETTRQTSEWRSTPDGSLNRDAEIGSLARPRPAVAEEQRRP